MSLKVKGSPKVPHVMNLTY